MDIKAREGASQKSIEIFCCYAPQDQAYLSALKGQLSALQRQGLINQLWADNDLQAGAEWEAEIDKHLNSADIILLLISPDFMASDYCYSKVMKRAVELHEQQEAHVIPIILRPVSFQEAPFGRLQILPTDAVPVVSSKWHSQDDAWYDVAEGIRRVAQKRLSLPWVNVGKIHFTHSRYEEALAAFRRALRLCPDETEIYYFEADALCRLQHFEEALASFNQIISFHPNDTFAYVIKGHILSKLRRTKEALAAFNKAIELDPDNGYAYYSKSWLLTILGPSWKCDEALAAVERALRLGFRSGSNSYNASSYHLKGNILCHLERYDEALIAFEQATRLAPGDAACYYDRGNILLHHLKRFGEAAAAYEQAIHLISKEVGTQNEQKLRIYRKALALATAEQAVQLRPDDACAHIEKGHALYNTSGVENYMGGRGNDEQALVH